MPTKRQNRSSKRLRKAKSPRKKFPELLKVVIDSSDILLEILDSRFIQQTRNNYIEELIKKKNKKIIYVLNKSDLISKENIDQSHLENLRPFVLVSSLQRKGIKKLRNKIKEFTKTLPEKKDNEKFTVGVIGYPNTGKSSVINILVGKKSAKTARTSGFTKGLQKIKLTQDIMLLDSPGVIPEREYSNISQEKLSKHAMVGARDYHKVKDPEIIISQIVKTYKNLFEKFYKIEFKDSEDLIQKIGEKNNIFQKKGLINEDKTARLILKDWQEGKFFV